MLTHLRANLWLLFLTAALCCVAYPLVLWGIGRTVFRHQAEGSLLPEAGGSRLIAQPFSGNQYFQPRPSAAGSGYDAMASGGSNLSASNPKLRDRVARQLGPLVKYRSGSRKDQEVGPFIETWLTPELVRAWADKHPDALGWWFEADKDRNTALIAAWQKTHPDEVAAWKKENPDVEEPKPSDLVVSYFAFYAQPEQQKKGSADTRSAIQSAFFDAWLCDAENAGADLEPVPADAVMASGSGLDPDITLKNAEYQLDRVASEWAKKTGLKPTAVKQEIEKLLREKAAAPLGGLAGVPLVNVLEINRELDACVKRAGAKER